MDSDESVSTVPHVVANNATGGVNIDPPIRKPGERKPIYEWVRFGKTGRDDPSPCLGHAKSYC